MKTLKFFLLLFVISSCNDADISSDISQSCSNTAQNTPLSGEVSVAAGEVAASADAVGAGTDARFNSPSGMTILCPDVYILDTNNNKIKRMNLSTNEVFEFADISSIGGSSFNLTNDGENLYLSVPASDIIVRVTLDSAQISTFAGDGTPASADGVGTGASFDEPRGLIVDGNNLYVNETGGNSIRVVNLTTREVTTLVSGIAGATSIRENVIVGDTIYVTDTSGNRVHAIDKNTGSSSFFAGSGVGGSNDGIGTLAEFNFPNGITTDQYNLFVVEALGGNIRKIEISTAEVTTIATGFTFPGNIITDGFSLFFTEESQHNIRKIE